MNFIESGKLIAEARKEKGYTQKQLGEMLNVGDKAVSKWENGGGSPDVRILADLAEILGIDEKALLSGIAMAKTKDNGNLKKTVFYVCPLCQNVITSTSKADLTCCGKKLTPLRVEKNDSSHNIKAEEMDGEYYITVPNHPMDKEHYISFICYVTGDRMYLTKLYPEQSPEARIIKRGHGFVYAYCNNHGLYRSLV